MGRVFRPRSTLDIDAVKVLIPDLWGESSDNNVILTTTIERVLIPDLWGESSDLKAASYQIGAKCLNPRFVGRVFRLDVGLLEPYQYES